MNYVTILPSAAKYPLPPNVADLRREFLALSKCMLYANTTYHKLKTFSLL